MTDIKSTHSNKYFDEWAKDKSPLLARASLAFAGDAEDLLELLQKLKSGELIEKILPFPPMPQWINLYYNTRKMFKVVVGVLRVFYSDMSEGIDFYEFLFLSLKQAKRMTPEERRHAFENTTPDEQQQIISNAREGIQEFEEWLAALYSEEDGIETIDEKEREKARRLLRTPEMIFFFRVWIPCFLIYGTYPSRLLRKARQGNEDAIEKMLRLDKWVIDDQKIKEIFKQASVAKNKRKFDRMSAAIQKETIAKIEIKKVKYALAGLISVASIALRQRLTAAEIHRLFDTIARDSGKGIIDDDLVVSPETFEKAIQRARPFWQDILKVDIK